MKKATVLILAAFLVASFTCPSRARDTEKNDRPVIKIPGKTDLKIDDTAPGFYKAASVDTYNIVRYDFETLDWQGWERVDNTADPDTFFHVDDFSGLGSGDFGRLEAIEGSQSIWCGARPADDYYMCSWAAAPGYGNNWEQYLVSEEVVFEGTLSMGFHLVYDCEGGGYDNLYIEYENDDGSWTNLATYGGIGDVIDSCSVDSASVGGNTRFRFHFSSDGAWSDEDGLWLTDGAAVIDSITVYDGAGYFNYEDFESASVGDHSIGIWQAETRPAFGKYSGLRKGMRILDGDPCNENLNTQIVFFEGSTVPADQNKYPGLYVTPFCLNGGGTEAPCQNESVYSPEIVMTKYSSNNDEVQNMTIPADQLDDFGGILLKFDTYLDLPLDNLVFHTWGIRNINNGCPIQWQDDGVVYYYWGRGYRNEYYDISSLVLSPNDTLQISLSVVDMCDVWGGTYGSCENHTPSPWFDNVTVQRYDISGPQWSYRNLDLFQDNFPPTNNTDGFVRTDMALNINTSSTVIDPGDSIVVSVTSPIAGGLDEDPAGGAAVYLHVKASDIGTGGKPDLYGPQMISDPWMTYISDDGEWTKLKGDTARTNDGTPVQGKYMFDLNDSLLTKGYMVEYYFSALDLDGETGYLPLNALDGGRFEFTCLPTGNTDILYVDDFDGRGSWNGTVQDYLDPALNDVVSTGYPDRYDVKSPSSTVGNGLNSRTDAANLGNFYHTIIWDSGWLSMGTIDNDDTTLLESWAKDESGTPHNHKTNLFVMGNNVVSDINYSGSTSFLAEILGATPTDGNYYALTGGNAGGGIINPLITTASGSVLTGLEDFYAFGGCPFINRFDVLETDNPNADYALRYPDYGGSSYYAAVSLDDTTSGGYARKALTTGFSFMHIRDDNDDGPMVRNEFLKSVFDFFDNGVNGDITDVEDTPAFTKLHGNYPNPFNPSTTIEFNMKAEGHVSIRIYDVAGRLVNTLVNEVRDKGLNTETWNGINNRGASVASGVYFYRMDTKDYSRTRKMILLR
ncbi:MAG: T9SS type A sorting domain-containing protein [Candidatus Krumholzibacteriota bacterium]|nr:T9SS type A sorting domain-containing protein [Candidatus Krumholzibacteriota bacterium]